MGQELEKVHTIIKYFRKPSLWKPRWGMMNRKILPGDFIEDQKTISPDRAASTSQLLKDHVYDIIKDLPPREQKILEMRFGLTDGVSHTLEEVGQEFGARERIRQIEAKALTKIQGTSDA